MKLKALYSAAALILLAGPVAATELTSSERASVLAQEEAPSKNQTEGSSAAGISGTAADEISAALKAKIRGIIAFLREQAHNASDDTKILRSRVQVHCSVRHITAKPKPSLTAAPTLLSEQATDERSLIRTMLEACTIKLLQVRSTRLPRSGKRQFSIELPPTRETTP